MKNENYASIWPVPLEKKLVRHQKLLTLSSTEFQRMRKDSYYSPNSCDHQKVLAGAVGRRLRGVVAMETEGAHEDEAIKYIQENLGAGYVVVKNHLVWVRDGNNSNPDAIAFNKETGRLVPIEIKAPRLNREVRQGRESKFLNEEEYAASNKVKLASITNEAIDQIYHAMYVLNATEGYIITVEQRTKLVSKGATETQKEIKGELFFHMTPTIRPSATFTDSIIANFCKHYNTMLVSALSSIACNGLAAFSVISGESYHPSIIHASQSFAPGFLSCTWSQADSVMDVVLQRVVAMRRALDEDKQSSLVKNSTMTPADELREFSSFDNAINYALSSIRNTAVSVIHRARFMNDDTFPFKSLQTSYRAGSVRAALIDNLDTYTVLYVSQQHGKRLPK